MNAAPQIQAQVPQPKPVMPLPADRSKLLGNIPKPGRDSVQCCYTSCTRC